MLVHPALAALGCMAAGEQIRSALLDPADATVVLSAGTNAQTIHTPNAELLARQFKPDQVMNSTGPISMWFDANPTYWDVIQRQYRLSPFSEASKKLTK